MFTEDGVSERKYNRFELTVFQEFVDLFCCMNEASDSTPISFSLIYWGEDTGVCKWLQMERLVDTVPCERSKHVGFYVQLTSYGMSEVFRLRIAGYLGKDVVVDKITSV